jgi:hypothetical protein
MPTNDASPLAILLGGRWGFVDRRTGCRREAALSLRQGGGRSLLAPLSYKSHKDLCEACGCLGVSLIDGAGTFTRANSHLKLGKYGDREIRRHDTYLPSTLLDCCNGHDVTALLPSKGFTRTLFAKAVDIEGEGRPIISLMQ